MCAATVDSTRQSGGSGRQGDWRQRANEVMKAVAANHGCAEQAEIRASEKMKAAVAKYGSVEQAENAAMRALTTDKEAATTDKESATTDKDKEAATTDKKVAATEKRGRCRATRSGCRQVGRRHLGLFLYVSGSSLQALQAQGCTPIRWATRQVQGRLKVL